MEKEKWFVLNDEKKKEKRERKTYGKKFWQNELRERTRERERESVGIDKRSMKRTIRGQFNYPVLSDRNKYG